MKSTKLWVVGIVALSAASLRAADLGKQLQELNDKEKVEATPLDSQVSAVNAKYAAPIAAIQKQLDEQNNKMKAELTPLQTQLKAVHDKYAPRKQATMNALDMKQKLADLAAREAAEKKAMGDKKAADLKNKAMKPADVNKKFSDDMKAMEARYKTDRASLDAGYKKALAESAKK